MQCMMHLWIKPFALCAEAASSWLSPLLMTPLCASHKVHRIQQFYQDLLQLYGRLKPSHVKTNRLSLLDSTCCITDWEFAVLLMTKYHVLLQRLMVQDCIEDSSPPGSKYRGFLNIVCSCLRIGHFAVTLNACTCWFLRFVAQSILRLGTSHGRKCAWTSTHW